MPQASQYSVCGLYLTLGTLDILEPNLLNHGTKKKKIVNHFYFHTFKNNGNHGFTTMSNFPKSSKQLRCTGYMKEHSWHLNATAIKSIFIQENDQLPQILLLYCYFFRSYTIIWKSDESHLQPRVWILYLSFYWVHHSREPLSSEIVLNISRIFMGYVVHLSTSLFVVTI